MITYRKLVLIASFFGIIKRIKQVERIIMDTILSSRLTEVATFVPKGSKLLDVGSDHAYLPIALIQSGHISSAIAGEVAQGPYDSAVKNVAEYGLSDKIEVRLANGLAAFQQNDGVTTITICGMGGRLIADILEAGKEKLAQVERLILQPNNREDDLRTWLVQNHFTIVTEKIMTENRKFYEILVAEHGEEKLTTTELRFGKHLLAEKSEVFLAKWAREIGKLEVALSQIPESNNGDRSAISQKIKTIQEVLDGSGK